jgi:hypothetical protein
VQGFIAMALEVKKATEKEKKMVKFDLLTCQHLKKAVVYSLNVCELVTIAEHL